MMEILPYNIEQDFFFFVIYPLLCIQKNAQFLGV